MSRLSRGLAGLAVRTGLGGRSEARAEQERRRRLGWRAALEDGLLRNLERLALGACRPAGGGLGGEHRSRARAASSDFVDYRPYRPGDDFRQIDWNAYRRLDQLYVKLTEARERLPLHILLDCSASMEFGSPPKLDFARQLAAVLGYVALARYDRVELVRLGGSGPTLRPLQGRQRFAELVAALDACRPGGAVALDADLTSFRPSGSAGQALLISDMLQPDGYERGLERLVGAGLTPALIQVLSPDELRPQAGGDCRLEDLESGEVVEVGLSPQAVQVYQRRLAEWCDGVERFCARRGIRYLRLSTDQPLSDAALVHLRKAGFLT